ncbi:hypothetical protein [Paenibacillus sp. NPDC055715]
MDKKLLVSKFSDLEKIQNEQTLRINLYGYLSEIILSTELFRNNKELYEFFATLKIDHKDYLYSSRTLLIAMTIRKLKKMDIKRLIEIRSEAMDFLLPKVESELNNSKPTSKKGGSSRVEEDYVGEIINKYSRSK